MWKIQNKNNLFFSDLERLKNQNIFHLRKISKKTSLTFTVKVWIYLAFKLMLHFRPLIGSYGGWTRSNAKIFYGDLERFNMQTNMGIISAIPYKNDFCAIWFYEIYFLKLWIPINRCIWVYTDVNQYKLSRPGISRWVYHSDQRMPRVSFCPRARPWDPLWSIRALQRSRQ